MLTCLFHFLFPTGLRPVDFWGNCYMSNTTDVELAVIDPHKVGSVSKDISFVYLPSGWTILQKTLPYAEGLYTRRRLHVFPTWTNLCW